MSTVNESIAHENDDRSDGDMVGESFLQKLMQMGPEREQKVEGDDFDADQEERDQAARLGISVFELRDDQHHADNMPILIDLASVTAVDLKWLWPERIPLGKITVFSGDGGLGKSYVALDIAARVSNGCEWPGEEEDAERGRHGDAGKEEGRDVQEGGSNETQMVSRDSEYHFEERERGYNDAANGEERKSEAESLEFEPERLLVLQQIRGQILISGQKNAEKQAQREVIEEIKKRNEERERKKIARSGGVLILSAEDNTNDTIVPRLKCLGANLNNFKFMHNVRNEGLCESFSITRHMNQLEIAVRMVKNCKLVIIDPLSSYLDNMGGSSLSAVRKALDPLKALAERCGVAIILINHLNKKSGAAIYRSAGSISIVAIARTVWGFARCKHDPKRCLMVPLKNNLGDDSEGLVYSVTTKGGLVWDDEPIEIRADEAFGNQKSLVGRNRHALSDAVAWLKEKLSGQKKISHDDIEIDALNAGISLRTLVRAKKTLGVVTQREKLGWVWHLPVSEA